MIWTKRPNGGWGLIDGGEDYVPQIPPDLEIPNLPMLGDGRLDPQRPEPAVTPGMEALQATLGQFMGTMAEMI